MIVNSEATFFLFCLGLSMRVHALKNRKTFRKSHVLQPEDITSVVSFIHEYANQHGTPGRDNVIKLSSRHTKKDVYKKYCTLAECQPDITQIGRTTFVGLWKKYCPDVIITKVAEDRGNKINSIPFAPAIAEEYSDHVY